MLQAAQRVSRRAEECRRDIQLLQPVESALMDKAINANVTCESHRLLLQELAVLLEVALVGRFLFQSEIPVFNYRLVMKDRARTGNRLSQ